ncbi:hypothetical protein KFK09_011378 [Dendrobium nobile]|uniref:Uncharacterized protein n=1 Tax=Dendrobium nobile TaxID=94219 RepID=A0A8T3BCG5_DENNO|nr:hypothetical protein KFK09_011378 [Dendrobium nobile]
MLNKLCFKPSKSKTCQIKMFLKFLIIHVPTTFMMVLSLRATFPLALASSKMNRLASPVMWREHLMSRHYILSRGLCESTPTKLSNIRFRNPNKFGSLLMERRMQ